MTDWALPRAMDDFEYRGIDTVFLENEHLRVMVLPGKGGDVLEFRDKRTDVDVLWHAEHNWQPPSERPIPSVDPTMFHDHYPGGWQVNLPVAGYTEGFYDVPYGLHGESALLPFEYEVWKGADAVELELRAELVRYPFEVTRTLRLPADESRLAIEESVTNHGTEPLPYIWQHHLALGTPLLGPDAELDIPAVTGVVHDYGDDHRNARLSGGETFAWPIAPSPDGDIDLSAVPPEDGTIHDVAYATELEDGRFAMANDSLDLRFEFAFPLELFETVWYWQAFGGDVTTPYFGRNYNAGLEPTTAYPSDTIPAAQEANDTMKTLDAGETVTANHTASTGSMTDDT
jgi:hypothetical protein